METFVPTNLKIPEFVMLVGLPGSGKSYLADILFAKKYSIHSSDEIRKELSGDINNQNINSQVFQTLHRRIKDDLKNGISCVYDATNINYKKRMSFLQELNKIQCFKRCIIIATPYEVCLMQNEQRERKVPEQVIERMYRNFDVPYYFEGWDNIELFYAKDSYKEAYGDWSYFVFDTLTYNQDNKYHIETLGEHCRKCKEYVENYNNKTTLKGTHIAHAQRVAAALHDCGKPFCKTFEDTKGNITESAHYYNHEKVGSYNSLFYETETQLTPIRLYIAALIRWHMQMHFIDNQPHAKGKYIKLLGEEFYKELEVLHNGDKQAH